MPNSGGKEQRGDAMAKSTAVVKRGGSAEPLGDGRETDAFSRMISTLTSAGLTQAQIGEIVGASLRTVSGWAAGTGAPVGRRVQLLLDLKFLVDELRGTYNDQGIHLWLNARNRNLDRQRPLDLLLKDQYEEVLEEAVRAGGGGM